MDWRGSGLKRSNSDEAMSSMTGVVDACSQIYPVEFQEQSIVWTNEKHNLYIKSLEASFVEQLHQSIALSSRNSPDQLLANTRNSSDKFTVLQDGCRKMLQPKSKLQMDTRNNNIREKPRIRNCRSSGKHYGGSTHSSGKDYMLFSDESCHGGRKNISHPEQVAVYYDSYHLSSSSAELSDQNFIDEPEVTNRPSNE